MPTLFDYFNNDFKEMSLDIPLNVKFQFVNPITNVITNESIEVKQRIYQHMHSSTRHFTYYIPLFHDTLGILMFLIENLENQIKEAEGLVVIGGFSGDVQIGNHKCIYSNRIYFYTEQLLKPNEIVRFEGYCKGRNIFATIRSSDYLSKKMRLEKPVAFISHDSKDKDIIARPLAFGLSSRLCTVWYDEYSLKIGDSLRESIEKGIKEAKKCLLILTPNFLSNPGWGKREFNSIFTREMICNQRIVLPIWYEVTKEDVYEYSPSLADTFALQWPISKNMQQDEYNKMIEQTISKIHTVLAT